MGSSRLPGKIMSSLDGKTFLEHVLDRCQRFEAVDGVICATTDGADCDVIVDLCRKRGYRWFRGSERDVLSRYYLAAASVSADAVIRITSDCPFADPEISRSVIERFTQGSVDLVTTNIPPSWPLGLDSEIFGLGPLSDAFHEATTQHDREHVSTFIRCRPTRYRLANIPCPMEGRSHYRLTLDTPADRDMFLEMAERLGTPIAEARWSDLVRFLDHHPEVLSINSAL